jgi:hypothetical protein
VGGPQPPGDFFKFQKTGESKPLGNRMPCLDQYLKKGDLGGVWVKVKKNTLTCWIFFRNGCHFPVRGQWCFEFF